MVVYANVTPYNKELCFTQPEQLYPAAPGVAKAIADNRLIEKEGKK